MLLRIYSKPLKSPSSICLQCRYFVSSLQKLKSRSKQEKINQARMKDLAQLYHAGEKYITTTEELNKAIDKTFDTSKSYVNSMDVPSLQKIAKESTKTNRNRVKPMDITR